MWCRTVAPLGLLFVVGKTEVSRILWNFAYYILLWNSEEDREKEVERGIEKKNSIVQSNNCKLLLSSYESRANKVLEFVEEEWVFHQSLMIFLQIQVSRLGHQIFLLCLRCNPYLLWTSNRTSLADTKCHTIFTLQVIFYTLIPTKIKNNIMYNILWMIKIIRLNFEEKIINFSDGKKQSKRILLWIKNH